MFHFSLKIMKLEKSFPTEAFDFEAWEKWKVSYGQWVQGPELGMEEFQFLMFVWSSADVGVISY